MPEKSQTVTQAGRAQGEQQFPSLRRLGLCDAELTALRHQGYVQRDQRLAGKRAYWRLRFRFGGRMRTLYLGTDSGPVASVQRELAVLQATHQSNRQLARAVGNGKRVLRQAKIRLAPVLAELGYHFHGDAVRKFRDLKNHSDVEIKS